MDVTPELISIYLDGGLPTDEAAAVEEAIRADASLAATADELRGLGEFLGEVEPVEISEGLRDRLYELDASASAPEFEIVRVEPVRRSAWRAWVAAAAAVALVAVGLQTLAYRPEVTLRDFSRQSLDAAGGVTETQRAEGVLTLRAGETIRAGEGERVSFRLPDGSKAVLFSETTIRLGDPRRQTLVEVEDGTLLCSMIQGQAARSVRAAGYYLRSGRADFGVRVEGQPLRAAGAVGGRRVRVTVTVSRGELEVGRNGGGERVGAYEEIVLEPGSPPRRMDARGRPIYDALVGAFDLYAFELLPGYFSNEHGVTSIPRHSWMPLEGGDGLELVVSDEGAGASAGHLVLRARADRPTRLALTLVRPLADEEGGGEEITVPLGEAGTDWSLLSIPMAAFRGPTAVRKNRKIPVDRRLFVRLELRSIDPDIPFELNGSLWAARPPADRAEVER